MRSRVVLVLFILVTMETMFEVHGLTMGGNWSRLKQAMRREHKQNAQITAMLLKNIKMVQKTKTKVDTTKLFLKMNMERSNAH